MKKTIALLTLATLLLNGCATPAANTANASIAPASTIAITSTSPTATPPAQATTPAQSASPSPSPSAGGIEVNKGLLTVEVTIPAALLGEDADLDATIEEAKAEGVTAATKNEDGSLTYHMTKAVHKQLLVQLRSSAKEYIESLKADEATPSIQDITTNDDLTEMTMTVDREAYENSMDGFAVLGLVTLSAYYQAFNGVAEYKMTLTTKDEKTGKVISTTVYPDAMEGADDD